MIPIDDKELLSASQIAKLGHVTRMAINKAINLGKLKATLINDRWYVTMKDFNEYRLKKYSYLHRKIKDNLVFDTDNGELSIPQVSKILSEHLGMPFPEQRIYYLCYTGALKAYRKGRYWIVRLEDVLSLLNSELVIQQKIQRHS